MWGPAITNTHIHEGGISKEIIVKKHQRKLPEREEIQKLARTFIKAYYEAMKEWGLNREKKFMQEGWRKMRTPLRIV